MEKLTTSMLTESQLASVRIPKIMESLEQNYELQVRIKVFEAAVWFPKLQAQVNASSARGMRGHCRGISVLTWCCAGRCMITISTDDSTLTLITADDEKPWRREIAHVAPNMGPMGLQHINADYLEALKMLYIVTRYGDEISLVADESVSVSFMGE